MLLVQQSGAQQIQYSSTSTSTTLVHKCRLTVYLYMYACNSCKTLVGVHKVHRCMVECSPIKVLQLFCWPMTPLSSLAYPMITHTPPVASNLPIKTLVARPTANKLTYRHTCTYTLYDIHRHMSVHIQVVKSLGLLL